MPSLGDWYVVFSWVWATAVANSWLIMTGTNLESKAEGICELDLYKNCLPTLQQIIVSRSWSWYIPEPGFESSSAPGEACTLSPGTAASSQLGVPPRCSLLKWRQPGSVLFLSSCSVLWAAVVGKCWVINNSYINAKAAGREMSVGNGISNKCKFRNSANF